MSQFFAHTLPGRNRSEWQRLEEHLRAVAEGARRFAAAFQAGDWGYRAGLWHDLGKYSQAFQGYLATSADADSHVGEATARTDHSTAGAQHAVASIDLLGHLLAYVISGHHSGLLDGIGDGSCLDRRLRKKVDDWSAVSDSLTDAPPPSLPPALQAALARRDAFAVSLFVRMIFSCLVDADFLDTEAFMDPARSATRADWPDDILEKMGVELESFMRGFDAADTAVNRERAAVRTACLAAAADVPGMFSLTVPTGGGKTLSSLSFALRHAVAHGLTRVVYVIPFTSIIEQNAEVFRKVMAPLEAALGSSPVLEHHSNIDVGAETVSSRLSSENWNAPLVVTTSVQFYGSLFANRTSRCRKLHNLAGSVVILDEAQTMPVQYLEPCLRLLRELAESYGASVVLCTATQPAIHVRDDFPIGLRNVREIIPDPQRLYTSLKRVEVKDLGPQTDAQIAARLLEAEQALCVVNTRGHARELFDALGDREGHYHLSALMCPEHRSAVFDEVRTRLNDGLHCRVVSTQLIEAGVDIDFPVVYRSLAGLDSVAQAAGRCNRNGQLSGLGTTFIFRPEHVASERYFAETATCASQVLGLSDDPLSLRAVEHFFRLYYWAQTSKWDAKDILGSFHLNNDVRFPFDFQFARVGRDFRLIEHAGEAVIVPWGEQGRSLCERLRHCSVPPPRAVLRGLQRYTVQIPQRLWRRHLGRGIELVHERYPVLVSPEMNYSDRTGLSLEEDHAVFLEV